MNYYQKTIIFLIILVLGYFYYNFNSEHYDKQETNVLRAIDGDTIETDLGKIRLLGINTPEKNQPFYQEAKDFLKQYEGKTIEVELHGKDKYSRWLGYIFYNNELINKKIIENGFANLYYYDKDNYYNEMKEAQEIAINNQGGLWKKSNNSDCITLISLEYKDGGDCKNQERLILNNSCSSLNVIIKDDANHIYNEKLSFGLFIKNYSCIWNDGGDTLFIRDKDGLILVYGY